MPLEEMVSEEYSSPEGEQGRRRSCVDVISNFISGLPGVSRGRSTRRERPKKNERSLSGPEPTLSVATSQPRGSICAALWHGAGAKRRASSAQGYRRQLSRRVPRRENMRGSRARRRSSLRSPFLQYPVMPPSKDSPAPEPEEAKRQHPVRRLSRLITSAGPAIVRRMSQLRRKSVAANPEFEDVELAPLRYKPVSIKQLTEVTRFSKEELQFMYRGFKQECPTGIISEETFKSIYGKFFPICGQPEDGSGRNTAMYAHYVFGTMDQDGSGHITFGDFIMGLSVLLKGSLQERINWAFNLYDINNDGYITKEELVDIVTSIYDLMGDETHPGIDDETAVAHVERLFDKLDLNKDGVVTIDEFMEYCSKNEDVVTSMNIFDSI